MNIVSARKTAIKEAFQLFKKNNFTPSGEANKSYNCTVVFKRHVCESYFEQNNERKKPGRVLELYKTIVKNKLNPHLDGVGTGFYQDLSVTKMLLG